jgi:hypothetical protein
MQRYGIGYRLREPERGNRVIVRMEICECRERQ